MKKSSKPSFVLELKLNTSEHDDHILNDRFFIAFLMQNRLISHAKKQLRKMRRDKEYRQYIQEYFNLKGRSDPESKRLKNAVSNNLSSIRESYGLSEYKFHAWVREQQHRYSKNIDSFTAQKIASRVWSAVEKVLFSKGKTIHFKRFDALYSIEGKSNASGIRFVKGRLHWNGLVVQPQIRKCDTYAREALTHKVKYCRIKRKAMGKSYHYYLELVLEGRPPRKHTYIDGRTGLDPGTSSMAVFSENGCLLTELAPERPDIENQVSRLQRKLDRSRRANNPGNYNPDGTVKKSKKTWVKSKTYKQTQMRLKTVRRKNAATVKQSEETLANDILENLGSDITTEKMDYKTLQVKVKETKVNSKGKFVSKKRFGKSLGKHSPSAFLDILERKVGYDGKTVRYVDTWHFKASQYDHVVGDYISCPLSSRSKTVGGHKVQRDLYSAFLLWAAKDETTVDRNLCFEYFQLFLSYQSACISKLKDNEHCLSSFGLKDFVV